MDKLVVTILTALFAFNIYAQNKRIVGRVFDDNGETLIGAKICQDNSDNCTYSDFNGLFDLCIDKDFPDELQIDFIGFEHIQISNIDTINSLIEITMIPEISVVNIDRREEYNTHNPEEYTIHRPYKRFRIYTFEFVTFIQADFIFNDFSEFETELGDYNVDFMNKASGVFGIELAGIFNERYYAGFNFGFSYFGDYDRDSLDIEFNTTQYGLHCGYNLINSKRIMLTPKAAIKWNRFRLINNDEDRKITIDQYITDRDIDIRFNQITGFLGLNLAYKFYNTKYTPEFYYTFGIYGGYCYKINSKPLIYSRKNRLTNNGRIGIENYNIGFYVSYNFGNL